MTDQARSDNGVPQKDARPSPDVEGYATDGQSNARGKGASDEQGERPPYAGDGPGKVGLTNDTQPDLVTTGGVNERDDPADGNR